MPGIELPSVQSLRLSLIYGEHQISTATGFLVVRENSTYLVTNRHVVTGRHQETGAPLDSQGATPQFVDVLHNSAQGLGNWLIRRERLYDEDIDPLWFEHPVHGGAVDVVALRLMHLQGVEKYPYNPWQEEDVRTGVTTELSIVGFPFGLTGGAALAIWSRGTIASEPNVDLDLPRFYIDSRTRQGQSGSPVIYHNSSGSVPTADGGVAIRGTVTKFVGVYSGRVNPESDLGIVWKAQLLQDILIGERRGANPNAPS